MFPYNDELLRTMLRGSFQYGKGKPRGFFSSAFSDYAIPENAPLPVRLLESQQQNWVDTANDIVWGLQQQLHRKLYGTQFRGDPKALNAKLKVNAPEGWRAIKRDMEEKWVPYLWQQIFYNVPYDPRLGSAPLKKAFPKYYSSILASLLGEPLYPLRQI